MAQDQNTVKCAVDQWTLLTNTDVSAVTFQVLRNEVFIRGTTDTTTPTEAHGIVYQAGQGELQKLLSASGSTPGLFYATGIVRLWAKPTNPNSDALVFIDHA